MIVRKVWSSSKLRQLRSNGPFLRKPERASQAASIYSVQLLHVELLCNVHRRFWVAASYTAF